MSLVDSVEPNTGCSSFTALAGLDQAALDALPEAVYLCASDGRVVRFNQKAAEMWGRTPGAEERFCGSFRLYRTDGALLPHDQCPMAATLQTGASFDNQEVVVEQPDGQRLTVLVNIAAIKDEAGRVSGAINCFRNITERKRAEDRQLQLIHELNHRIKNTFATVHSVAVNTARSVGSIEEFTPRFEARLLALSAANTVLSEGQWKGAKLRDLLAQQLEPFGDERNSRVRFEGPVIDLQPQQAVTLSMIFHELATNAAKYGALSVEGGQVSVVWDIQPNPDAGQMLTLQWAERGGPPVDVPQRRGFGMRLIETLAKGVDGEAGLNFDRAGLQLRASIPLRDLR